MSLERNSNSEELLPLLTSNESTTDIWHSKEIVPLNTASCIFHSFVGVTATICNGVVLLMIYRDSTKCFRTVRIVLVVVILLCGLINGLVLAPLNAYSFKSTNKLPSRNLFTSLERKIINLRHGLDVSTICLSTISLAILMVYSWNQIKITRNRGKSGTEQPGLTMNQSFLWVATILIYSMLFALSPFFSNLSWKMYHQLNLHLNLSLGSIFLILTYLCLYFSYLRQNNSVYEINFDNIGQIRINSRSERDERQLALLALFLIIVQLAFTLPLTVGRHLELYSSRRTEEERIRMLIAIRILEEIFLLKYVAMPIVFVLGSRKHREAFKKMAEKLKKSCRLL